MLNLLCGSIDSNFFSLYNKISTLKIRVLINRIFKKMDKRKQNLLKIIVSQYIETAEPVSSKLISEAGDFDLSSATIRNEMADLEDLGYIFHPHTSAGRVPTEKGYLFFIENFLIKKDLPKKQQETLNRSIKSQKSFEPPIVKELAKALAELCENAVFVAFSDNDFYYTGLANLFSQPEFVEPKVIYHLSQVIDHLDLVVNKFFHDLENEIEITLGRQNPFGLFQSMCHVYVFNYHGFLYHRFQNGEISRQIVSGASEKHRTSTSSF